MSIRDKWKEGFLTDGRKYWFDGLDTPRNSTLLNPHNRAKLPSGWTRERRMMPHPDFERAVYKNHCEHQSSNDPRGQASIYNCVNKAFSNLSSIDHLNTQDEENQCLQQLRNVGGEVKTALKNWIGETKIDDLVWNEDDSADRAQIVVESSQRMIKHLEIILTWCASVGRLTERFKDPFHGANLWTTVIVRSQHHPSNYQIICKGIEFHAGRVLEGMAIFKPDIPGIPTRKEATDCLEDYNLALRLMQAVAKRLHHI